MRLSAGNREYVLGGKVGDGAAGVVRKARRTDTGTIVAIKFLAPDPKYIDPNSFDDVAERFRREGTRGAGLDHENLVKILAYEDNAGSKCFAGKGMDNPFIVMEFVRGTTLDSLIRSIDAGKSDNRSTITPQTLHVARQVVCGLVYLHERRVTHRDVKPANIFMSSATPGCVPRLVALGDFGVTKWGDFLAQTASGILTTTHQQNLGTYKYMSPEQAVRPRDVTVRSDIFSLGVTLFELFTGRVLPSQHHVFDIMSARMARGTIASKLYGLDISCDPREETVFEMVLDMFLRSAKGRPASKAVDGRLAYASDLLFSEDS